MVLKGQRLPSREMILRLANDFHLSKSEQLYFELLVSLERNKKARTRYATYFRRARKASPETTARAFHRCGYLLSDRQVVLPCDQATGRNALIQEDSAWIRKRLRNKVTGTEIRTAIQTMIKLNLLERDKRGTLRVKAKNLRTSSDIPSGAIRSHHMQMMLRAIEATQEQRVEEREITSITIQMDRKHFESAKKRLREFRDQFNKEYSSEVSDSVWQLNIQLFEHTRTAPSEKT